LVEATIASAVVCRALSACRCCAPTCSTVHGAAVAMDGVLLEVACRAVAVDKAGNSGDREQVAVAVELYGSAATPPTPRHALRPHPPLFAARKEHSRRLHAPREIGEFVPVHFACALAVLTCTHAAAASSTRARAALELVWKVGLPRVVRCPTTAGMRTKDAI